MKQETPGVWRQPSIPHPEIGRAEPILSELLCDPNSDSVMRFGRLDEIPMKNIAELFVREIEAEFKDYQHYKSRPVAAEDDVELTGEMFERD